MLLYKLLNYLFYLIPWFISSILFSNNSNYYNNLNLPIYAINSSFFAIIWTIIYILVALSIFLVINKTNKKYIITLIINFISNQLFTFFFFTIKNNFLALLDVLLVLISTVILFKETYKINKNASYLLIFYLLFNFYALALILGIIFLN